VNRPGLPEAPELVGSVGQSAMAESCPSELREPAVRIVVEHEKHHDSQWGAIRSISEKVGCTSETLRRRVRQVELDGRPT